MFLLRIAFVLVVIIMLLPIGNDEAPTAPPGAQVSSGEFVDAAVSAAYDVSGICSRQPLVCRIGGELWTTFQRKATAAAGMLYSWASGDNPAPSLLRRDDPNRLQNASDSGAASTTPRSDRIDPFNTLTDHDLAPAWQAPARSPG